MKLTLVVITFVVLVASGCYQESHLKQEQEILALSWVEKADPEEIANRDIAQKQYRFFYACGVGQTCEVAGIGTLNAHHCYASVAREGLASFHRVSDEVPYELVHLEDKANEFATQYNKYVAKYLADHGKRTCGSSADWDGALSSLGVFITTLAKEEKYNGGLAHDPDKPVILVSLKTNDSAESILPKLCMILASHGLGSEVDLAVRTDGKWEEDGAEHFRCVSKKFERVSTRPHPEK